MSIISTIGTAHGQKKKTWRSFPRRQLSARSREIQILGDDVTVYSQADVVVYPDPDALAAGLTVVLKQDGVEGAHRLSTFEECDMTIKLEDSRLSTGHLDLDAPPIAALGM